MYEVAVLLAAFVFVLVELVPWRYWCVLWLVGDVRC